MRSLSRSTASRASGRPEIFRKIMDWITRIRSSFDGRKCPDDDVIEELAQHAAAAYNAARADGCSSSEAEARISDQISRWAQDADLLHRRPSRAPAAEPPPASSRWGFGLVRDFRYALRLLRRQPGHTAAVLATIVLGVAVAGLLFSVTYGVLLKPLPWPDADQLVRLYETRQGSPRRPSLMTNASYLAWRENPATLEGLGAWSDSLMTLTGTGDPERITITEATPGLFSILRALPVMGRLFSPESGGKSDETEAILSHSLWEQRFGGRTDVLGRDIILDGRAYHIIGVMPASFAFPDRDTRAWLSFLVQPVVDPAHPEMRSLSMFAAIGRLRAGASAEQAAAEGTARVRGGPDPGLVAEAVFGVKGAPIVLAVPYLKSMTENVRQALLVFLAAVGLLLAVATGNVALLQLARGATRHREFAIRAALGAGSGRLMRQMLVENIVLGTIGGGLAIVLVGWLHHMLPILLPDDFPRAGEIAMDWRVAGFALALSLLASVMAGLLPALHTRRLNLAGTLAEDGSAPVGGGSRTATSRTRAIIMAAQVAMACVLLVGAGLLMRSFVAVAHADRGYDPENVLTARLAMPSTSFTDFQRAALLTRLIERLKVTPGVTNAAVAATIPLGQGRSMSAFTMTRKDGTIITARALQRLVSTDYFAALRIRLLRGRLFSDSDANLSAPAVMVVNRAFASQYFHDDAVGTPISQKFNEDRPGGSIIGVVENVSYGSVTAKAEPEYYMCTGQLSRGMAYDEPYLIARTHGSPANLLLSLRSILKEQDPLLVPESMMTMTDRLQSSLARPRLYSILLGGFAGFALLIAGVGLFGTLSYGVAHRAREIAVRTALGAAPRDIVILVASQALIVTACGAIVGVAAAAALVRLISSMLYGVTTRDPVSFTVVPLVVLFAAAIACMVPARRASRIDPNKLLH